MSVCIHRELGKINRDTYYCRDRMHACRWYRVAWCVPVDMIGAVFKALWKMLFLI